MRVLARISLLLGLALAAPVAAQVGLLVQPIIGVESTPSDPSAPSLLPEAAAIIQYDDNEVDTYVYGFATTNTFELMMRFDSILGTDVTLGGVDVCMQQTGSDSTIRYEVVVWSADGPGGTPGTELAHYAALATGVTATPSFHSTNFTYPFTTYSTVYIGVRYNPIVDPSFHFCVDLDGATVHPAYYRNNETGSWGSVPAVLPSYNAMMFRAYVYTPGVFQESLLVPGYLVDRLSPAGTATLFAVRNLTASTVNAEVEYFDVLGTSLRSDPLTLGPNETYTANVRDTAGLPADVDGYARGYIEISTAGDPHQVPVLGGDFFQIDVAENFATGDKLVRFSTDLCSESSIRFLAFPFPGSGTRLSVWIANPRGEDLGDPPSFSVRAYDEAGNPHGAPFGVFTANHALQFDASTFAGGLLFGFLKFDFSSSFGGVVYSEAQAGGKFSVGMTGQCHEAP
ncbi:MAG: hypothetical protein ABI689_11560 [Thermoanaerobaculia bacterium]